MYYFHRLVAIDIHDFTYRLMISARGFDDVLMKFGDA
jgi:hypothetical protein